MVYDMYAAAVAILNGDCPPNLEYCACRKGVSCTDDVGCKLCWQRYLMRLLNLSLPSGSKRRKR